MDYTDLVADLSAVYKCGRWMQFIRN